MIISLFLISKITSNKEYKQYTPRDAENLASGLNRPSGCVGYFIRDDSLIQYREILHSASPRVIFPDIQRYFVTRGCASHDKIPLNIGGNVGISLGFPHHSVNIAKYSWLKVIFTAWTKVKLNSGICGILAIEVKIPVF